MKTIKSFTAVLMTAVLALGFAACKGEVSKKEKAGKNDFYENEFYVMVGTTWDDDSHVRFRYFKNGETYSVEWEHAPDGYEYGDVFIAKNGTEPEYVPKEDMTDYRSVYFLRSGAELEFAGNCKDLMKARKLKVTSADYDGMGHWSIHLEDKSGNEYYYGFVNNAYLGVNLEGCSTGDIIYFAFMGDEMVVPLREKA